ncbi:hypothetical protein SANTM175S_06326 [Streptomyces antimycoticus]
MAGVALALVVLGHEGERHALLGRDLLGAGLVDDVLVAGGQGVVVAEGDLVLAEVALPLGRLDGHPGGTHLIADAAQQGLDPAGAEDGVVDVVLVGGGHPAVAGVPRLLIAVPEDHELQLGAGVRGPAALGEPVELTAQDLARGGDHGAAVMPGEVRGEEGGAGVPGGAAQGGGVAVHGEVAVAALPGGHGVAVDGVHLGVDGEEVVAALGAVCQDVVEEEAGGEPLALQPSLHIGEGQDNGVDLPGCDQSGQLVDRERGRAVCHGGPPASESAGSLGIRGVWEFGESGNRRGAGGAGWP